MSTVRDASRRTREKVMSLMKHEPRRFPETEIMWPDDAFDRIMRDMFRDVFASSALAERFAQGMASPLHVEEFIDDGTCVIRAELPGIDPEKDVEITVREGVLNVRAHREERKKEDLPEGYRSEFRYGSFRRVIPLPEGASESDVKASYKDGILEIRVPVAETAPSVKRIAVEKA